MILLRQFWTVFVLAGLLAAGCNHSNEQPASGRQSDANKDSANYLLSEEPAGATGVIEARQQAKNGDEVVVVGRVGGSKEPIGKGRAYFTFVDPSLKPCSDPSEDCPAWSYG